MAKDSVSSLLTSVDELFTTQEERDIAKRETVMDIPLAEISDFPNHPFNVTVDEKLLEMADSVKRYGVLVPAIVRPKQGGGYEMIAGHRRKMASELAERPTLNCIVRDLSDDEAIIIMVDSNLQREVILPSEKAFAYKMKLDAMKRQGQRTDALAISLGFIDPISKTIEIGLCRTCKDLLSNAGAFSIESKNVACACSRCGFPEGTVFRVTQKR